MNEVLAARCDNRECHWSQTTATGTHSTSWQRAVHWIRRVFGASVATKYRSDQWRIGMGIQEAMARSKMDNRVEFDTIGGLDATSRTALLGVKIGTALAVDGELSLGLLGVGYPITPMGDVDESAEPESHLWILPIEEAATIAVGILEIAADVVMREKERNDG